MRMTPPKKIETPRAKVADYVIPIFVGHDVVKDQISTIKIGTMTEKWQQSTNSYEQCGPASIMRVSKQTWLDEINQKRGFGQL